MKTVMKQPTMKAAKQKPNFISSPMVQSRLSPQSHVGFGGVAFIWVTLWLLSQVPASRLLAVELQ
jgi:hypothetical protein